MSRTFYGTRRGRSLRALLLLVFFLSGASSLIYQVAWQRLLTVYYGVGFYSIVVIVSVYMFGLGVGALLGGAAAERVLRPIITYFFVELSIGLFGAASPFFLDWLGKRTAGSAYWVTLACVFVFLSVPTLLMGMTLPLLTKIFNAQIASVFKTVSQLYFVNTLGAAIGCVFAAYVLISISGLDVAVYFAAVLNVLLALLILASQRAYSDLHAGVDADAPSLPAESREDPLAHAYLVIFVSGFLAIGYEVVWFRVIGFLIKDTAYAFASVLSVFLLGTALGSRFVPRLSRRFRARSDLYLVLQVGLAAYSLSFFVIFYVLTKYTPFRSVPWHSFIGMVHPELGTSPGALFRTVDVFLWPAVVLFVPTLIMGASFPLASSILATDGHQEGRAVGRVYFANVMGNVLGGLVTGFVLLPLIGSEITLVAFICMGACALLLLRKWEERPVTPRARLAACAAVWVATWALFPRDLCRTLHFVKPSRTVYAEEGGESFVINAFGEKDTELYINGSFHGIRPELCYAYEAGQSVAFRPEARDILDIGFGSGNILEALLRETDPARRVTLVEVSGALLTNARKLDATAKILSDPRLTVVEDDGRRFLYRTIEKFDVVVMDPLRTMTAYSNNIYSQEFFTLVKQHLKPGGVFSIYTDEYQVMPRTLATVYTNVAFFDFFMVASDGPLLFDRARFERLMGTFSAEERAHIVACEKSSTHALAMSSAARDVAIPVNTDWKPITEYYLGAKLCANSSPEYPFCGNRRGMDPSHDGGRRAMLAACPSVIDREFWKRACREVQRGGEIAEDARRLGVRQRTLQ